MALNLGSLGPLGNVFSGARTQEVTTQAPPVTPDQPGNPPSMPGTNLDNIPVPPDTLQLGQYHFSQVRALAEGITPQEAAALTQGNGYDEIYFTDETGKSFVAFMDKTNISGVKPGYLGRFNDKRVKVISVEDETNTFKEGFMSVFGWTRDVLTNTFGNEASKSLSGVVSTVVGSFVAASALKGGAQAAAPLIKEGFLASMRGAVRGVLSSVINTFSTVALFIGAGIGVAGLIAGAKAATKKSDFTTIDMVTGNY